MPKAKRGTALLESDALRDKLAAVVQQSLGSPGEFVQMPAELSAQLNAAFANAILPEILEIRARERTVSTDTLRMTLR